MSTVEEDFSFLGGQGYTGTINDRMFAYLGDLGYTGALNDRLAAYHAAQGHEANWLNLTAIGGGAPDTIAPLLTDLTVDDEGNLSFFSDEAGTAYWLVDSTASYADADALIAAQGAGDASGSFAAGAGSTSEEIDVSGVANGSYYFHVGMLDAAGNASNVLSDTLTIDVPVPAMSVDPDALFWYAADSVTEGTGGDAGKAVVVADKTSNGYDFDTLPTGADYPAFDGTKLSFNGVDTVLRSSVTGPLTPKIYTDADEFAVFAVVDAYNPPDPGSSLGATVLVAERLDLNVNQALYVGFAQVNSNRAYQTSARYFANAYLSNSPNTPFTKEVVCWVTTQTDWYMYVNNVQVATGSVTTANLPRNAQIMTLGGAATASSFNSVFSGDIYEIFATHDASSTNRDAITDELAALHGVTL